MLINLGAVQKHATQHDDALFDGLERTLGEFQFRFERDGLAHACFDLGEKADRRACGLQLG
jgi:hypothetical protein